MNNKEILISFFLPSLEGGGVEKVVLNLVNSFAGKGFRVDLVLIKVTGPYLKKISKLCRIIDLKSSRTSTSLLKLVRYLRLNKPFILISNMTHLNVLSTIAIFLAHTPTKLIIVEHNNLSEILRNSKGLRLRFSLRFILLLMFILYPKANKTIAVSKGVAEDLEKRFKFLKGKIIVIYNPVNISEISELEKQTVDNEWFNNKKIPLIISVGRLTLQKDYQVLLKAFSIIRNKFKLHLVILGEGEDRLNLSKLAKELGIYNDIWMPGFVDNPYRYVSRSNLFVLSSRYEGFGNVIVEALACGTPVVSTDCESGPGEILDNGRYGKLVAVGDFVGMADAIIETLKNPLSKEFLIARANQFDLNSAVKEYLEAIQNVCKF
jgi:glycosyltransferase involved in cell wall biosynthesis